MLLSLALLGAAVGAGEPVFQPSLLEVRLDHQAVPAGGALQVVFVWQNTGRQPAASEYRVFVHMRRDGVAEDAPGVKQYGADHAPAVATTRWRPGRVVRSAVTMPLPADVPPGEYLILVGLFDPDTGERLELSAAPAHDGRRYLAARFTVLPAGGAAGAPRVNTYAPVPADTAPSPLPPPPARTVSVGRGPLRLVLDATQPCPVAWRMNGNQLPGDPELQAPVVRVLSVADGRAHLATSPPYAILWAPGAATPEEAVYHAAVTVAGQPAVAFDLVFRVRDTTAEVRLANVAEQPGHALLAVRPSRLVTTGRSGRLALPWQAGRLIDPARAEPAERSFGLDWYSQALCGIVTGDQLAAALDLPGIDDQVVATVDRGWASLGATFAWRQAARPPVPSLRLTAAPRVRIQFTPGADWTTGARLLRADVPTRLPAAYREAVIYKIFCDSPGAREFITFDQCLDLTRQVANLTDGLPQIAYLVGWQHRGHDTGYPDVFTVNERLGGAAGLRRVMEAAAQHHAVISFHDNYDDAYEHSPAWNPDLVARNAAGELQKGGVWAGGQSWILSFGPTGTAAALDRVERTLATYPIRESYHIDVLSAVPVRHDFSPHQPASAATSLAGKRAIIEAFNRRGVDVTSEGLVGPFVGVIGHSWHLQRQRTPLFGGEECIPLTPFLYHGHVTWGGNIRTTEDFLDALVYGATASVHLSPRNVAEFLDRTYLIHQPFRLLRDRELTGYRARDGRRRVSYGDQSYVEVDDAGGGYDVVVDGRLVARQFTSFVPSTSGPAWLAYARAAGPVDYPAPPGWADGARLELCELMPDGPGAVTTGQVTDGRVRLELKAGVPVRVRPF